MSAGGPRVLFYSHNGVGVGHFRRQLKLARQLRERVPKAAILMVTGSHSVEALNGPFGFDCVSLPAIRMVDRYENWEPRHTGMTRREVMRLRSDLLRRTVRRFRPDLLLADFMPAGPHGELRPALEELAAGGGRAIAGFRDIIDEPAFVRDLWQRTGVIDVLRDHYAAIWVYGTPEVMDFGASYGLSGDLGRRTEYLGYLCPPDGCPGDGGSSAGGAGSAGPAITASTGGGVDGGALLGTFVEAMRLVDPTLRGRPVVVAGPLLSDEDVIGLQRTANGAGVEVRRFLSHMDRRIACSDLVVTMPGYNTSCELLGSRARAVVVPRSGPSREQRLRAAWLARWGSATSLEPDGLTAEELAAAVTESLQGAPPSSAPVPRDGLARAGQLFEQLLSGQPAGSGR